MSHGWVLIQYYWCPHKNRKLEHGHTQRKDQVRTPGDDNHLQANKKGIRRKQCCLPLDLGLTASMLENPDCGLCYSNPNKLTHP